MPSKTTRVPKLCRHPSGQACVYHRRKAVYLGKYGTAAAQEKYRLFLANWSQGTLDDQPPVLGPVESVYPTVDVCLERFWAWSEQRYRHPDGSSTLEAENFRHSLKPLRKLFWDLPIDQIGPRRIREVRDTMVRAKLARNTINRRVGRIRQFLKWCVGHELCPPSVLEAARAVEPLRSGMGGRETLGRKRPVAWATVEATLPHLSPLLQSFVRVLWHTGCRVGELRELTPAEIDLSGDVWQARLKRHKNSWRSQERVIYMGPDAQAAIQPWLETCKPDRPIFCPRLATERTAVKKGERSPGKNYRRQSLTRAIIRACQTAGIEPWKLGQIRHAFATRIREEFGIETAQILLGHARLEMTNHYSCEAIAPAIEAVRKSA